MAKQSKIVKPKGIQPNPLEEEVAKALNDIEAAPGSDLKADLREFQFSSAKEIDIQSAKAQKSAIVVFVPYRVWRNVKKVNGKLIREMEKKFQKKYVVIVANRTIMDKNFARKGIPVRPRNRTLTAVHQSILEDVVTPTEIVGQRTKIGADGSKLLKVFLDKKDREAVEEKLSVFSSVYRTLTTRDAEFYFQ